MPWSDTAGAISVALYRATVGVAGSGRTLWHVEEAFLIPVKAFHLAKRRLRGHMPDTDRVRLARWLATRVVAATSGRPTFVACDDSSVAEWATENGATVIWGPGLGLNGAVDAAVARLGADGFDHVTVCHGDLPFPDRLTEVAVSETIVIVPDRVREGTNVLSRPVECDFPARYGPGSFAAHLAAATDSGCEYSIRIDDELAIDFDTIDDARNPRVEPLVRELLGHSGIGER